MMDGRLNDKEFGRFLKENADNHRLYPSDEVWNKVHARLHTRKRWYAAGLGLLLLTALAVTSVMLLDHGSDRTIAKAGAATKNQSVSVINSQTATKSTPAIPLSNAGNQKIRIASPDNQHDNYFIATNLLEINTAPLVSIANRFNEAAAAEANPNELAVTATHNEKTLKTQPSALNWPTLAVPETAPITAPAEEKAVNALNKSLVDIRWMEESYPLTIESVTNSYERQKHSPKFNWQLHFTPTISYRSLKEDAKFIAQARMNLGNMAAAATPELSNVIKHRPDLGLQLGIAGSYPIGKRIDWIAGLQFNVSKYDIKAFNYPTEVATIALVNSWGGSTAVTTVTSFRSNGFVNRASWLRNYYYSVSIPMGLEWRVLGKKKNHWGISATMQPTYVVGNRSYIISMDYQNYAEVPYLIRKWNLNLGLETYARFQLGKRDFKLGPQLRYQAFSSFKKGYPMQEHLYDFGFKLGMTLGK